MQKNNRFLVQSQQNELYINRSKRTRNKCEKLRENQELENNYKIDLTILILIR